MLSSNVGSQTRWDNHLGVFRTSPGDNQSQSRVAQTAALVHFSKIIGFVNESHAISIEYENRTRFNSSICRSAHYSNNNRDRRFSRSGSVPNLSSTGARSPSIVKQNSISPTAQRIRHHHRTSKNDRHSRGAQNLLLSLCPTIHCIQSNCVFSGDCIGNKRERTKRSDTSKRHVLARQKQIDSSEIHNNAAKTSFSEIRR